MDLSKDSAPSKDRRSKTPVMSAAVVFFVALSAVSCGVSYESDNSGWNPDEQVFLDILSGPIRDRYDSTVLIEEGRKACAAFSNGQSERQVMEMIQADLGADPGMAGQFIGAVKGGMSCHPK